MTPRFRIERYPSLRAVTAREWDHVAARYSVYGSHGWLLAVEDMPGALDTAYYMSFCDDGEPTAAFAAYLVDGGISRIYHPAWAVCGEPPGESEQIFPSILLGGRGGYTSEMMTRAPADDRVEFWSRFSEEIWALAAEWGARSAWLLHGDSASASAAHAVVGGSVYGTAPTSVMRIRPEDGPDAWLAALHSHRRSRIRREMRAFSQAGYRVDVSPLSVGDAPEFGALLANQLRKYRGTASSEAMKAYVLLQAAGVLSDVSVAFRCYLDRRLVGFSFGFEWNNSLYMRVCGFDYGRLRNAYEYFNLAYYYPIREACSRGLRQIEFGPASYQAKLLRGARPEARYAVGRHPGRAEQWAGLNRQLLLAVTPSEQAPRRSGPRGSGALPGPIPP